MGHKTHPYGFRLGIIKDWKAHWYAQNGGAYRNLLNQDLRLRESIKDEYKSLFSQLCYCLNRSTVHIDIE